MGGGGMRAAAKVAGVTVANGGLRGIKSEHCPIISAACKAASLRPGMTVKEVNMLASQSHAGARGTSSEAEDRVFTAADEAIVMPLDVMPRVIFGGPPTLQEAKEATSELTAVLEKTYPSASGSVGYEGSSVSDQECSLSPSSSQVTENKVRVNSEIAFAPAVPAHAIKAFRLLHESSAAQNVVASIACDPNVWNAVLHNPELQEFLQSQGFACSNMYPSSVKSTGVVSYSVSPPNRRFMDIVEKIEIMVNSMSDYFRYFFGGRGTNGADRTSTGDAVMEASFMGLAVMAIMVILLKRV